MDVFAISDMHLDLPENRVAFEKTFPLPAGPGNASESCLILAGDICESPEQLEDIIVRLKCYYRHLVWTPGNHELWVRPSQQSELDSFEKYQRMVALCRSHSVATPEDEFPIIDTREGKVAIAALFLLYDYSFRPGTIPLKEAVNWAIEADTLCTDEVLIRPGKKASVVDWCRERLAFTEAKLTRFSENYDCPLVLVNHFPLKENSFSLPNIPRFSIWCGTRRTENWHCRFNTRLVVNGHIHTPGKQHFDNVPFYEVSLGYPGQWDKARSLSEFFVKVLE